MCSSPTSLCLCIPLSLQHTLVAFNNHSSHAHHQIFYSHNTVCQPIKSYCTHTGARLSTALHAPHSSSFLSYTAIACHLTMLTHPLQSSYSARFCEFISLSLHINSAPSRFINNQLRYGHYVWFNHHLLYLAPPVSSCTPTCI